MSRTWQSAGQLLQFVGAAVLFRDYVGEFAFVPPNNCILTHTQTDSARENQ